MPAPRLSVSPPQGIMAQMDTSLTPSLDPSTGQQPLQQQPPEQRSTFMDEKSEADTSREASAIVTAGMKLISGQGAKRPDGSQQDARSSFVNFLRSEPDTVEAIGKYTQGIIEKVSDSSKREGVDLGTSSKLAAGLDLVGMLSEEAHATGVATLDQKEQELAYSFFVQTFINKAKARGEVSDQELKEGLQGYLSSLGKDKISEINKSMLSLNDTAKMRMNLRDPRNFKGGQNG